MSRSVFIASSEGFTGKSTVALGLLDALSASGSKIGVFRPIYRSAASRDEVADLLVDHPAVDQSYEDAIGVPYQHIFEDPESAEAEILSKYLDLADRYDHIVVVGSDYLDVTDPAELGFNARIAADIAAPVVLVLRGTERSPMQVATLAKVALAEVTANHAEPIAVIANRVAPDSLSDVGTELAAISPTLKVAAIPEHRLLMAPTVKALLDASNGRLIRGSGAALSRASLGFVVAAMSLPEVLTRLTDNATVIAPGDRQELLPALLLANRSDNYPNLASIVLTGGREPSESMTRLIDGLDEDLPIIVTDLGTYDTAAQLSRTRGRVSKGETQRTDTAKRLFKENVSGDDLVASIAAAAPTSVTPLAYQATLLRRAKGQKRRIVLPEGDEPRILAATDMLLKQDIADLVLLGDEDAIRAKAAELGHDIAGATIESPANAELLEKYAAEFARLRAKKGVTLEQAREQMQDLSYFATMMVQLGDADGMVSGAVHSTANTIRPALQVIKTRPGASVVSSVFLMLLEDRVLVYGDAAVNPDPTAEQLADIAISSAATAEQFGVTPRVAMLSYSTGTSGAGEDVDKVRAATDLVKERAPELSVEGPIQYDAAVDASVARTKLPDSAVAGRATVFIFPDLNTGNNTYKAVQRSAGAIAIGPVLQGLKKPVNDLSRGALVADIVNTVVITAIQAQQPHE